MKSRSFLIDSVGRLIFPSALRALVKRATRSSDVRYTVARSSASLTANLELRTVHRYTYNRSWTIDSTVVDEQRWKEISLQQVVFYGCREGMIFFVCYLLYMDYECLRNYGELKYRKNAGQV